MSIDSQEPQTNSGTFDGRLNGTDLHEMFAMAAALLQTNVESINSLNVFPVPDGDTGTNMYLTLRAVVDGTVNIRSESASVVSQEMSRSALMGARGNSGVILSQFFKGISIGLADNTSFGVKELTVAYTNARDLAYRSVSEPVEGTILTVMSSMANAAREVADRGGTLVDFAEETHKAACASVAKTPELMVLLREAGVVDAGGQGLAVILTGIRNFISGTELIIDEISDSTSEELQITTGRVDSNFLATVDGNEYGYCTQLLLEGINLDTDQIMQQVSKIADSPVVVGDPTMVKIHVHSNDPGPVLSFAVSKGVLKDVNISNMDDQHAEFSAGRISSETKTSAMIAVALGEGILNVFRAEGACQLVSGGNTMNPSVEELTAAIDNSNSDSVVLLPNNSNILLSAKQAADLSTKNVRIIPTNSVPHGIAAALAFDEELDIDHNVCEMTEAVDSVQAGEVTIAIKAATINGVRIEDGQFIGLLDQKVVGTGNDPVDVLELIFNEGQVAEGNLVTLYSGSQITENTRSSVIESLVQIFPQVELELIDGGQPNYHFLISIE